MDNIFVMVTNLTVLQQFLTLFISIFSKVTLVVHSAMVTCLFYFLPNTIIAHTDQLIIWILIAHAHIYVWIEHSVWQYDSARVVTKIIRRFKVSIECVGWGHHSSLNFLILLFTKPNMEVSGWLYQTKTHFTHIVYHPFSRVSPPSFTYVRILCQAKIVLIPECKYIHLFSTTQTVVLLLPFHLGQGSKKKIKKFMENSI